MIINPWWWTITSAIILFWTGPFTPAMPLQFALAIVLKKIYEKVKNRKKKVTEMETSIKCLKCGCPLIIGKQLHEKYICPVCNKEYVIKKKKGKLKIEEQN